MTKRVEITCPICDLVVDGSAETGVELDLQCKKCGIDLELPKPLDETLEKVKAAVREKSSVLQAKLSS
jgi:Zn-finger nucleic acid-binding protein